MDFGKFTHRKTRCRICIARCDIVIDTVVCNQIVAVIVECGGVDAASERLIVIIE